MRRCGRSDSTARSELGLLGSAPCPAPPDFLLGDLPSTKKVRAPAWSQGPHSFPVGFQGTTTVAVLDGVLSAPAVSMLVT